MMKLRKYATFVDVANKMNRINGVRGIVLYNYSALKFKIIVIFFIIPYYRIEIYGSSQSDNYFML